MGTILNHKMELQKDACEEVGRGEGQGRAGGGRGREYENVGAGGSGLNSL